MKNQRPNPKVPTPPRGRTDHPDAKFEPGNASTPPVNQPEDDL
jgi:hypothetical protein